MHTGAGGIKSCVLHVDVVDVRIGLVADTSQKGLITGSHNLVRIQFDKTLHLSYQEIS